MGSCAVCVVEIPQKSKWVYLASDTSIHLHYTFLSIELHQEMVGLIDCILFEWLVDFQMYHHS